MKIAIHYQPGNNFSPYWKQYCEENKIPHKIVNCYENDIIDQLRDCNALMWHVNNYDYQDQIFAKYLIRSLENIGIKVFPNHNSVWHFDDKVAQKYLLESVKAPLVPSHTFYSKEKGMSWVGTADFPKVFKLRRGSGSKNVLLIKTKGKARNIVSRMFGKGIKPLNMYSILKERYRKYKLGKESFVGLFKGLVRLIIGTPYLNMSTREKGYVYFQDFMPDNDHDQRIIVIGNRAIFIKRMVRKNDFRASGSGHIIYDKKEVDLNCIKIAFEISDKLNFNCMTYDFLYDEKKDPRIIEISFGFNQLGYLDCQGFWDENLNWHNEEIKPQNWMIEDLISELKN